MKKIIDYAIANIIKIIDSNNDILMHLVSVAEQVNKLKEENAFEILEKFSKQDLKGLYDTRNFIAHDYDGIDLSIIENILRYGLPSLKASVESIVAQKQ